MSQNGQAVRTGPLERLDEQRVPRVEVRVETAVREAGLLHHVGHAHTRVAMPADRARGRIDDALVRLFLASVRSAAH